MYNNIVENFGFANKTVNNIDYSASASFETNESVNTSMMVESLKNIINSAVNDVKQNNTAQAAALASAVNSLSFVGVNAKNIILKNITQVAEANVDAQVDAVQTNISSIVNTMETSIQDQITKNSNVSDVIKQINEDNLRALQATIDALPPVPNVPKKSAGDHINNFFGSGNKTTNNINVDYENNVKKMLQIDDSFKVSDNSNLRNELTNTVTSASYAECEAKANLNNAIALFNGNAENIVVDTLTQEGIADLNLRCAFNQTNISNISNKIVSQISTTINNLYKGIQANPDPKKSEFLHYLGGAISDKIIGASGAIPPNYTVTGSITQPNNQTQGNQQQQQQPSNQQQQQQQQQPSNQQTDNQQQTSNNMMIYGVIGIIVFLFLIIIIFILVKK